MEELSYCPEGTISREGEVCHNCVGVSCGLQPLDLACEMEDGSFYNSVFDEDENVSEYEEDEEVGGYDQNFMDQRDKSTIAHRRWEELYDYEGSKKLRDAMKRHLYREKYEESALDTAHLWMEGYNPPSL